MGKNNFKLEKKVWYLSKYHYLCSVINEKQNEKGRTYNERNMAGN